MIRELGVLAFAALFVVVSTDPEPQINTSNFAQIQTTFYNLLWHVDQPDKVHPGIYKLGTSWDIESKIDLYTDKAAVTEFLQRYNYGMLPRGQIFSVYYPDHLDDAVALFKIFYAAGDVQTFCNTAAWARVHMNVDLFVYAFSVAVFHRPDTVNFRLPLPYEIQPNYFFNTDVIQQAYDFKMALNYHTDTAHEPQTFIVYANYSSWHNTYTYDPETKMNYYFEDVDLNAYYYYINQEFPFWMSSKTYNLPAEFRGEFYYYIHKMLLNRYRMERMSYGLGDVELFDWGKPIMTGYTPTIAYPTGYSFPGRQQWTDVPSSKYGFLQKARDYEARITAAINYGYLLTTTGKSDSIYTQKGFNMICNVIEGNADSTNRNFYGSIDHVTRKFFGFNPEPICKYEIYPSALEHPTTSLRDPAIYRIYKRILYYLRMYKTHMKAYTRDELFCKGVEIESVAVDKLETFFDYTDSLISNVVKVHDHQDAESILIKARQYRLNHKPFTYHMTVKSDRDTKATVRIFLGPKYNIHGKVADISKNYDNFYQLDYFLVDLKAGLNKIERKSIEAAFTVSDYESSDIFYKNLVEAVKNGSELPVEKKMYGFPNRLTMPKGTVEGMPVQFFFYVNEFVEGSSQTLKSRRMGEWLLDNKAFGFPLDRRVIGYNFTQPNMFFKDAHIYHNDDATSNLTA